MECLFNHLFVLRLSLLRKPSVIAVRTRLKWGGGGGDKGAGARENRGREGYGRRERKGREAGVLRGREAGEQYKTMNFFVY